MSQVTIPRRFNGPRTTGNGGWSAGALADLLAAPGTDGWPVTTVQLRQPPPLDSPMSLTAASGADGWRDATDSGTTVLRGRLGGPEPRPVPPVDADTARAAEATYPGLVEHPFSTCFVCGTDREPGDGLRIFPGRVADVEGRARVAATWTPNESTLATTWAALDCPGAWALDFSERLIVLGQMTARVHRLPEVGRPHVVVGLAGTPEGRKQRSATSLYDDAGTLLASTEQVWFAIDPEDFA